MEKYKTNIIGTEITTTENKTVGKVAKILINLDTGKVIGLLIKRRKLISTIDIINWKNTIKINDADDIITPDEVIEIKKVLKDKRKLIGSKVVTKAGKYIGIVVDYSINTDFYKLTSLVVAKKIFFIKWHKRIIPATEILEIKRNKIIIKSRLKSEKIPVLNPALSTKF